MPGAAWRLPKLKGATIIGGSASTIHQSFPERQCARKAIKTISFDPEAPRLNFRQPSTVYLCQLRCCSLPKKEGKFNIAHKKAGLLDVFAHTNITTQIGISMLPGLPLRTKKHSWSTTIATIEIHNYHQPLFTSMTHCSLFRLITIRTKAAPTPNKPPAIAPNNKINIFLGLIGLSGTSTLPSCR